MTLKTIVSLFEQKVARAFQNLAESNKILSYQNTLRPLQGVGSRSPMHSHANAVYISNPFEKPDNFLQLCLKSEISKKPWAQRFIIP